VFLRDHQSLVTFFNHYYLITHYTGLLLCLAWAFFWHRPMYRWCRRMLVITTAMLTVPFQSIPVAPPRLVPELGLVDTTHVTSLRGLLNGLHDPGQLTAMPSVHGHGRFWSPCSSFVSPAAAGAGWLSPR
jgi:hypothetical protein